MAKIGLVTINATIAYRFSAGIIIIFFASIYVPGSCRAVDFNADAVETISGCVSVKNGFAWRYGYDIRIFHEEIIVSMGIHLTPTDGVSLLELNRVKGKWEKAIEDVWSNQFEVKTLSGKRYSIIIDVTFNGKHYHHNVTVRPGGGRSEVISWNIMDTGAVVAHEFGHLIGIYDEYHGGAVDPELKTIDEKSIMTSNPVSGITYSRHYKQFLQWFGEKTGQKDAVLVSSSCNRKLAPQ